jgi:hypothetical protein
VSRRIGLGVLLALVAAFIAPVSGHAADASIEPGIPRYDHVFTIVLENENFDASWGGNSTYLQGLRAQGAFADHYYGVSHVSADNYIAMTSGQPATPPFNFDCINYASCEGFERAWPDGGRSIADQVEDAGLSWKAYMESMPGPCVHPAMTDPADPYQTGYATRHNPFVYYPPIVENVPRCNSHVVPYTNFAADLADAATTPNYVFITPDTCHDGHDTPCTGAETGQPGGLASANAFLQAEVPKILSSPAWTGSRSLLMITFDENGFSDVQGCCAPPAFGGRVGLLALDSPSAAYITHGAVVTTTYDHWSYLRTVEDTLGISEHLNFAGLPTTHAMADLFAGGAP